MRDKRSFWDASAIAPLCIYQDTSQRARQIYRKYPSLVVWWATLAEARSAFARAARVGRADAKEQARAIRRLQALSDSWLEVDPDKALRDRALQLLDDHPLRTGDALQLAAALAWCKGNPHHRIFVCFDDRLATVAEDVGFKVIKA